MPSSGPNTGATGANLTGVGTQAWSNTGNAVSSNNSYAAINGATGISNYLTITNFGFSIPSGATIDGIVVEFERKASVNTGTNYMKDYVISLVKAGAVVGNNNGDTATQWSTTEAYYSYGSSSDLWGTSWSDTDINASNFGAALSVERVRFGKTSPRADVDSARITIHYTSGGGGGSATAALLLAGD